MKEKLIELLANMINCRNENLANNRIFEVQQIDEFIKPLQEIIDSYK